MVKPLKDPTDGELATWTTRRLLNHLSLGTEITFTLALLALILSVLALILSIILH